MNFRDYVGQPTTLQKIVESIENPDEYKIFVGTDSKVLRNKNKIAFVTSIVLNKKGKGGRISFCKENEKQPQSLKQRLTREVTRSLETSIELSQLLPSKLEITIHIDVNQSRKYKSSEFYQELVGMVQAQGLKCEIKPDAFAASTVSDKIVKNGDIK